MTDFDAFFRDHPEWKHYADYVVRPPCTEEIRGEFLDADSDVLGRCMEVFKGPVSRGAAYLKMRLEGADDRMAATLACQQFPGVNTTDTFWAGRKPFHEVFGEEYANVVRRELAKRGVTLKPGDEYMPELANRVGDPEAVVPFGGARSYIKNLCERRGWASEGAVTTEHRQPERDPFEDSVPLAEDLIRKNTARVLQKDPSLKKMKPRELREKVIAEHGPTK